MSTPCTQAVRLENIEGEVKRLRKEMVGNGSSKGSIVGRVAGMETMLKVILGFVMAMFAAIIGIAIQLMQYIGR